MTLARLPRSRRPRWLVNAHLQSIVPSLRLRRPLVVRRARQMLAVRRTQVVECGDGVRCSATIRARSRRDVRRRAIS